MAAIRAYERAEALGVSAPQLLDFRTGNWNTIPALRAHPDYAFPVMVAVDLESDPKPNAKPGERVFEVAAVRMKGRTILRSYQSYIRRPFKPAKLQTNEYIVKLLNLCKLLLLCKHSSHPHWLLVITFAPSMPKNYEVWGFSIAEERIVDTLTFANVSTPIVHATISHCFVKCIEFRPIMKSGIPHSTMHAHVVNSYMN